MLGEEVFRECKKLKEIEFEEGSTLQRIESECFSESGLEEITIPSNVITIERCAFYISRNLKRVSF